MRPEATVRLEDKVYDQFARIHQTHWWYRHRYQLLSDCLARLPAPEHRTGLDVGCGPGTTLEVLGAYCDRVSGVDVSARAIEIAQRNYPTTELLQGDANELGGHFAERTFGYVTILNVLYHDWIRSEVEVLKQVRDLLVPDGYVIVTEPAFRILLRKHDRTVMGRRRYRLADFRHFFEQANLDLIFGSYFNSLSFGPALILALLDRLSRRPNVESHGGVGELSGNRFLNGAMHCLLAPERFLLRHAARLPFGVSLIAVGRRKPAD